ncbi:MAG TPA: O-antigen ligase family protein, partial [Planctomycetota bacterium]|nr:O-antigen ligase family protein [Planctomycetota bacterium]
MRARAAGLVAGLGFLTLLTNRFPLVPAGCLLVAAVLGVRWPTSLDWRVVGVWAYWVGSFLMTQEPLSLLFSRDFHRRDGQIFFSTLPLLVFAWVAPRAAHSRAVLATFWVLQAVVAAVSGGFDLAGHRSVLHGLSFYPDEGPEASNYCGFYQAHNAVGSVQGLGVVVSAALSAFSSEARTRRFWGLLALPLLWGVILSNSRGSFLAMAFALLVLGVLSQKRHVLRRRTLAWVGLALLITTVLLGSGMVHRLGLLRKSEGTHAGRWAWWKRALEEWSWSPVVGEGMGRYNDHDREWSGVKHVIY